MSGAIPLLPLYAFRAWTGTTLPLFFVYASVIYPDFQSHFCLCVCFSGNYEYYLGMNLHSVGIWTTYTGFQAIGNLSELRYLFRE
jgi:hypothetical protein